MPLIRKFEIKRYKELTFDIPYGAYEITSDYMGGINQFVLETYEDNPNGNWHFYGLLKNRHLLGEIVVHTLDTGVIQLQQFNQLSTIEVNQLIGQGIFTKKENELIGWVELSKTIPSFFYQDCNSGKIPIVDLWYDYGKISLGENIVSDKIRQDVIDSQGNIIKQASPDLIGTWNFGETNGNWGTFPFPRQPQLTFNQYVEIVTNQSNADDMGFSLLDFNKYYNIPLLYANKEEHFDADLEYPTSIEFFSNKKTYGSLRRSEIPLGFKSSNNRYSGRCISSGKIKTTTVISSDGAVTKQDIDSQLKDTYDYVYDGMSPDELKKEYTPISDETLITVTGVENSSIDMYQSYSSGQYNRLYYHRNMVNSGINDPRDLYGDDIDSPMGVLHANYGIESEKIVFKPALLKETIQPSIPSEIGPIRKALARKMRREIIKMYRLYEGVYSEATDDPVYSEVGGTTSIHRRRPLLFPIGKDGKGIFHYSDNESFREKCVFTGYYNSFQFGFNKTMKFLFEKRNSPYWGNVYRDFYRILKGAGYTDTQIHSNSENIPVVYRSKTNKYYFSSTPSKTIFAGYFENDLPIGAENTKANRFLNMLNAQNKLQELSYINIPKFNVDNYNRPIFYKKGVQKTQLNSTDREFFGILSMNIYKDDFIIENTRIAALTSKYADIQKIPTIFKRHEMFIPNPMDNLLYSDMILWNSNLVNYDPIYSLALLRNTFGEDFYSIFSANNGRLVPEDDRYETPELQYSEDIGYYISITDKTYITDVYFGLMEMHIKGYPWKKIINMMRMDIDKVPLNVEYRMVGNVKTIRIYSNDSSVIIEKDSTNEFWKSEEFRIQIKAAFNNIVEAFERTWNNLATNIIKH